METQLLYQLFGVQLNSSNNGQEKNNIINYWIARQLANGISLPNLERDSKFESPPPLNFFFIFLIQSILREGESNLRSLMHK